MPAPSVQRRPRASAAICTPTAQAGAGLKLEAYVRGITGKVSANLQAWRSTMRLVWTPPCINACSSSEGAKPALATSGKGASNELGSSQYPESTAKFVAPFLSHDCLSASPVAVAIWLNPLVMLSRFLTTLPASSKDMSVCKGSLSGPGAKITTTIPFASSGDGSFVATAGNKRLGKLSFKISATLLQARGGSRAIDNTSTTGYPASIAGFWTCSSLDAVLVDRAVLMVRDPSEGKHTRSNTESAVARGTCCVVSRTSTL
mmetsp:Transcript_9262/g.20719  ORF Transcript_9262/g.20719 Transcript_9262/m.20719 type:complete len:260 (+) Transcript_9262:842-1621(+)